MTAYADRPWTAWYGEHAAAGQGVPAELGSALEAAAERSPDAPALIEAGAGPVSFSELAERSRGLAAALVERGLERGERLAVMLQNVPEYPALVWAAWRLGAAVVPLNPMWKAREILYHLRDSGAAGLVHAPEVQSEVAPALEQAPVRFRLDGGEAHRLARQMRGRSTPALRLGGDEIAFLTYTSGTTGEPKGAVNTHANAAYSAAMYQRWVELGPDDVNLGVAPLCHITGLIAGMAVSVLAGMPLVLAGRFEPDRVLDLMERHRVTFTVAALTAYLALLDRPGLGARDLSAFGKAYSGGAPVSPGVVERFEAATGAYIHPVYGLTETTSPSHATPLGVRAPVDEDTGALACGVPLPGADCKVVDVETRAEVPPGEVGEIVIRGPMVVPGYWNRPEASRQTMPDGWLHTGDVGRMDAEGWFYIVDRAKDVINASGYKVWPREVEDVLYEHPAVREAAVVGVPDPYRGETVKAFVALSRPVSEAELVEFCRARLAAYKYPRQIEVVAEVPKTTTGKFLRRALRG